MSQAHSEITEPRQLITSREINPPSKLYSDSYITRSGRKVIPNKYLSDPVWHKQHPRLAAYLHKYAIKIIKKAIKMKCVRTKKQFLRSVCNYMRCHCVPFGPFRFHSANKQMPVGY